MVLRVDYLIFVYMILCLCILLFDFYYMVQHRWLENYESKRIEEYTQELLLILNSNIQKLDEKQEKQLVHRLRNYTNLLVFHEAVLEILSQEQNASKMKNWLWVNRELFLKISGAYVKGDQQIKKALFAYIVWQYQLCGKSENDRFVQLMYQFCMEQSLYCRENALSGLYVSGSAKNVVKAYQLLSRQEVEHSPRLVTDGLLIFSGSHKELAEELWEHWKEFPTAYQVAFINYIRMTSGEFGNRFILLLEKEETDNEVKFAIIRYFRRYYYPEAELILQEMVRNWEEEDWEFASISALALENYRGNASIQALLEGCRSMHWYVRESASESLLKIVEPNRIPQIIEQETDPYAKDILTYKYSRKQKEVVI
ncbi:MAG: HEAT repeat domain-containing protein [Lachnospiraceae bacterium]